MEPFRLKLRVYYEDTDAGGVVYHARYLAFAERARTEALRQAKVPHDQLVIRFGLMFVVRRIEMDYLRPVRLDAEVIVETGPWAVGGATVEVDQRFLTEQGTQTGRLQVGLACVRAADGRPARIPAEWRRALAGSARMN
jgi:acyl-CoA thioester hydrolase